MALASTILTILSAFLLYNLITLFQNYRTAKHIGFPIIILLYKENATWYLLRPFVTLDFIVRRLPNTWRDWCWFHTTWLRYHTLNRIHERYGPVVTVVAPGSGALYILVADADVAMQMAAKRWDKPEYHYKFISVYGPSVLGTNGKDWARHRRYTQFPFNERNSALVWSRAISQSTSMISTWSEQADSSHLLIPDNWPEGIDRLVFGVFASAGYGIDLSYQTEDVRTDKTSTNSPTDDIDAIFSDHASNPGMTRTFRQVCRDATTHMILMLATQAIPKLLLKTIPSLKMGVQIREEMGWYIEALIRNARVKEKLEKQTVAERDNLLSTLVRNSGNVEGEDSGSLEQVKEKHVPLTHAEIKGNAHAFSVAGNESTIKTLEFAFILLAVNPEAQEWLQRGLDSALEGEPEDPNKWGYEVFGRLKESVAVMYETLRILTPAPHTLRTSSPTGQTLTTPSGGTHYIPAGIDTTVNASAMSHSAHYWGPDVATFSPSRWDPSNPDSYLHRFPQDQSSSSSSSSSSPSSSSSSQTEVNPKLLKPYPGSYHVFSEGVRACLGKKFATVEFVAVVSVVFWRFRVSVKAREGEGVEERNRRVEWELRNQKTGTVEELAPGVELVFEERRKR